MSTLITLTLKLKRMFRKEKRTTAPIRDNLKNKPQTYLKIKLNIISHIIGH